MFKNQGTSLPVASQQQLATVNGDKSWACSQEELQELECSQEELQELDEVQLATVVGGIARVPTLYYI
jgi:hypothetical protein